jgi:hypothetical protein
MWSRKQEQWIPSVWATDSVCGGCNLKVLEGVLRLDVREEGLIALGELQDDGW